MPAKLLQELKQLAARTEGLSWFAARMRDLQVLEIAPLRLPVCDRIEKVDDTGRQVSRDTAPAVEALPLALPRLRWPQSYTGADGFPRKWLDNYGWVNLVSPEGLYQSSEMRLSIGYWGAGQLYSEHPHAPEETYLILAGRARFRSEGRLPRDAGPGGTIHHAPHQKHAIDMIPGPLLAAAFWRGDELLKKSDLGARK
ncbi:dimethylsulfonioproprionate lyase family protein [Leisingera sp. ANG59]|uniref:dimethylsulfonioproprionate lyase family protein n=1 Tax=Leisingera sp. ANG59 TaxID=2675221 RepID=UPI001572291B|nr:dimethylsulfonioproprionate lyase family protein [Leisingera sp. ANG59]